MVFGLFDSPEKKKQRQREREIARIEFMKARETSLRERARAAGIRSTETRGEKALKIGKTLGKGVVNIGKQIEISDDFRPRPQRRMRKKKSKNRPQRRSSNNGFDFGF